MSLFKHLDVAGKPQIDWEMTPEYTFGTFETSLSGDYADGQSAIWLGRFGLATELCVVRWRDHSGATAAQVFLWRQRPWHVSANSDRDVVSAACDTAAVDDELRRGQQCGADC